MARWRYPTLSLHGIEGAFSGSGPKTVIPAKVLGKFSLRLVPDQDPKRITETVTDHLEKEFAKVSVVALCAWVVRTRTVLSFFVLFAHSMFRSSNRQISSP